MLRKPFRVPFSRKLEDSGDDDGVSEPRPKKRRIDRDQGFGTQTLEPRSVFKTGGISSLPPKPLSGDKSSTAVSQPLSGEFNGFYNVLWRKFTAKKHKTWDGDGTLRVKDGYAYLQDISGRDLGRTPCDSPLLPGSQLSIGGKEVEVDSLISQRDFLSGRLVSQSAAEPVGLAFKRVPLRNVNPNPKPDPNAALVLEGKGTERSLNLAAPRTLATQTTFKNPLLANSVLSKNENEEPRPRHDPFAAQALVMKRPQSAPKGKHLVDVVVDPLLTKHLREHQREGVKFMYECVMGMRDYDGQGAILADEMGLGKTLQTIALLWTLLKQNPLCEGRQECPPVIKKALIVCPVTLINNWRKEFRKWLGVDRLGVYVFDDGKKRITDFTMGKSYHVGIIGYEKLRSVAEDLKRGHGIDIVVVDEGHRLKTAKNKSAQAIRSLNTSRKVILTGTPLQNDLSEFYTMVDFVNPDLLGSLKRFTKEFGIPIMRSRQPGALTNDLEKGEARSQELASLTGMFILRRTIDTISHYLPSKTEYVLLCRPTTAQASAYRHVLNCPEFQGALGNSEAALQLLTLLKKVCNSPSLLSGKSPQDPSSAGNPLTAALLASVPPRLLRANASSTKLRVLDQLMYSVRTSTSEKIVLVSNYTATLDLLESLLTSLSYPYLRLDGSTPSSKRQELVDTFNHFPASECFAFLLSAKSGGYGLNLIGASRLVLFDVDWNPAMDLQAMARIHRDGQKRPCVIYRFVMAGALDEKIWQRQTTKLGLASNILDRKEGTNSFTKEELQDLFRLHEDVSCQTHDLLGCGCEGRGLPAPLPSKDNSPEALDCDSEIRGEGTPDFPQLVQANKLILGEGEGRIKEEARCSRDQKDGVKMDSLMAYSHIDIANFSRDDDDELEPLIHDKALLHVLRDEGNRISFIFAKTSG